MGVYTNIYFHNANDPEYQKALVDKDAKNRWENEHGPIEWTPGKRVHENLDIVEETDEEYGGWIIPLDKIPSDVTHIHISRG